jgi:hypothetical protein
VIFGEKAKPFEPVSISSSGSLTNETDGSPE